MGQRGRMIAALNSQPRGPEFESTATTTNSQLTAYTVSENCLSRLAAPYEAVHPSSLHLNVVVYFCLVTLILAALHLC